MNGALAPGSVFEAAGPAARSIAASGAWMIAGAALIFAGVMALLWLALRRDGRALNTRRWIVGGGLVFPALVLLPLLVDGMRRSAQLEARAPADALVIGVTARMWWWELRYHDPAGGAQIVTANELHVPVGRTIVLALASDDVIHSFWVPALAGKKDLLPGRVQHLALRADHAGVFGGQCAEYCGAAHARMGLRVVAQPPDEFERWLAQQRSAPAEPAADPARRGREAFATAGCASCHRIAGVASGALGPDLTHVASRATLGAGRVPNGPDALRAWITQVQSLKPGARMPAFDHLDEPTLAALVAYLASLR